MCSQGLRVAREVLAALAFRILSCADNSAGPQVGIHRGFRVEREEPFTR